MKQNLISNSTHDVQNITRDTKQQHYTSTKDSLGINNKLKINLGNLTLFYLQCRLVVFDKIQYH